MMGILHVAIQFPLYEYCKTRWVAGWLAGWVRVGVRVGALPHSPPLPSPVDSAALRIAEGTERQSTELTAAELVVTSAASKMVASTITYPHEASDDEAVCALSAGRRDAGSVS